MLKLAAETARRYTMWQMEEKKETWLKAGRTDGFRYIAIHPPVLWAELVRLGKEIKEQEVVGAFFGIEQIVGNERPCTQIQIPDIRDDEVERRTGIVCDIMEGIRPDDHMTIFMGVATLQGAGSSPFNTYTD